MDDLSSQFYAFIRSGNPNVPNSIELPRVDTIAEFEAVLAEVENMSDSQCRYMLIEALKLVLTQQKLLESVMRPKF